MIRCGMCQVQLTTDIHGCHQFDVALLIAAWQYAFYQLNAKVVNALFPN